MPFRRDSDVSDVSLLFPLAACRIGRAILWSTLAIAASQFLFGEQCSLNSVGVLAI